MFRANEIKQEAEVDKIAVLEQLQLFFMNNAYKGSKSRDFESYNRVLKTCNAILLYDEDEQVHRLCVNNRLLSKQKSIEEITKMIESLQALRHKNSVRISKGFKGATSGGNTEVNVDAGRDALVFTAPVETHELRFGGGDTVFHFNYTKEKGLKLADAVSHLLLEKQEQQGQKVAAKAERHAAKQVQAERTRREVEHLIAVTEEAAAGAAVAQQAQIVELSKILAAFEKRKPLDREREKKEKQDGASAREEPKAMLEAARRKPRFIEGYTQLR